MSVTLHANPVVISGALGVNGILVNLLWTNFNDAAVIGPLFKYFELQSCRIRWSNPTTAAAEDSFVSVSLAYFPINYYVEGSITQIPAQQNQVLELPGSIMVQPGARNIGRWFNPNIKQQFSTADAFGPSNRVAGSLIVYANDVGVNETIGQADVEVTVRFYQRQFSPSVVTFPDFARDYTNSAVNLPDREQDVVSIASCKSKKR
jgi:hypothetical protein